MTPPQKHVPDGPVALYRLFDRTGSLLYVGIANSPVDRWRRHKRDSRWWADVDQSRNAVAWYSTREGAHRAEMRAIVAERPRYNVVGRSSQVDGGGRRFLPVTIARSRLGSIFTAARTRGEHAVVIRRGNPVAVFVPPDWYKRASELLGEPWEDWEPTEAVED